MERVQPGDPWGEKEPGVMGGQLPESEQVYALSPLFWKYGGDCAPHSPLYSSL